MMKKTFWKQHLPALLLPIALLLLPVLLLSHSAYSHEGSDPVLTHVMIDQLEIRNGNNGDDGNLGVLEGQLWVGKDINKFWLKTDIERRGGSVQDNELQALYSRAISPFWDAQIGVRHDEKPTRDWGVIGLQGLSPYWFDVDAALFVGESGRVAARFSAEYELLFTQKLILSPNLEMNFYGQSDTETGTGSGLSDAKTGLRLRYEIQREFAPYVGINWEKTFGKTADFAKSNGEVVSATEFVVGLRVWF